MTKVTLLCLAADQEASLETLRRLGSVHLAPIRAPEGDAIEALRAEISAIQRALGALPANRHAHPTGRTAAEVLTGILRSFDVYKELLERRAALEQEHRRLAPFGSFHPGAVAELAARGIEVRLFHASTRLPVQTPDGALLKVLQRDRKSVDFAVISMGPVQVAAEEVPLPGQSLEDIAAEMAATRTALAVNRAELARFAGDAASLRELLDHKQDALGFLEARKGMDQSDPVVWLRGYCPVDDFPALRDAAAGHGWGFTAEDPDPEDQVPTLIRTPRWVGIIKPLVDFITIVPGYREVDISAALLVFFGMFFGIIVGDAGYGALFMVASLIGRWRFPAVPQTVFALLEIMSVFTIVWGVMTGNYFGVLAHSGLLGQLTVPWLASEAHVELLCFIIAVVHLTLAHTWNIIRMWPSTQVLAQIGWIFTTWTMFCFALSMVLDFPFQDYVETMTVLGNAFPRIMGYAFVTGVVLIVLFMTPIPSLRLQWFNHIMLPLNLVSNFVDVVSYIRLFAVGSATYAVASSFNSMLAPMFDHWWTGLAAAVFLFAAHALNIALSMMGVLVHGVRLNTLEFSGHIGLQWAGIPYRPFRRSRADVS